MTDLASIQLRRMQERGNEAVNMNWNEALEGVQLILLYFGNNSPESTQFTRILSRFYGQGAQAPCQQFEIVFVSMDRWSWRKDTLEPVLESTLDQHKDLHGNWYFIPPVIQLQQPPPRYLNPGIQTLIDKYQKEGVRFGRCPVLLLINPNGDIIKKDGVRQDIESFSRGAEVDNILDGWRQLEGRQRQNAANPQR